jgi:MFS family permease
VGVSSLLSGKMPLQTPLGVRSVVEIGSEVSLAGWLFLLTFIGWAVGGLYFNWVSSVTGSRESRGSGRAVMQTLLFSLIITMVAFMVGIPAMVMLGVLGLINPGILQVAVFLLALFSAWIVVPIFFAPHGIYLRGQNAFYSIYTSLRMARFTMPTSSIFVLAVFVISQGLNYLWAVPADNSWMRLVGISGHAFVTSALLAASFIYYRDLNAWLEIVFQRLKPGTAAPQT